VVESGVLDEVRSVVWNLASQWNGGRPVLERLAHAAGDPSFAPMEAVQRLSNEEIDRLFSEPDERRVLRDAFQSLAAYLSGETWFERAAKHDPRLALLAEHPIAYFCMEFGLAAWLPIYSGGLGVLAGDVLKESSDMGLPVVGVGLLYRRGFFQQHLDASGYQRESSPLLDPERLRLERAVDPSGRSILIDIPLGTRSIYAQAWKVQVGRTALYLLDTDVAENESGEDRGITASLYGGDQDLRIRQEIVLGIGGVRLLRALGLTPSLYSMNEGHAAFLGIELLAESGHGPDLSQTVSSQRCKVVYTNHTIVAAGNDIFPRSLVDSYLSPYLRSRDLNPSQILDLGGTEQFSMPVLAFALAGRANAVSKLHAEVIPREWPGREVEAVTNGVHVPSWIGDAQRALLDEYVPDWQGDNPDWSAIRDIPDAAIWAMRTAQRQELVRFVEERLPGSGLDPFALTMVWARRFAEYKRAWLFAADLPRLAAILADPDRPVQIVVSGKAHPKDEVGKHILQELLAHLESDPRVAPRVVFVEDYDLRVARYLTAGADVWINTPRKPFEASGTSGMKSSDNGGLQLTVRDGWAAEVDWWNVGWGISGDGDPEDAKQLYVYLEDDVVSDFFTRDENGVPLRWTDMVKNTMIVTLAGYSARRMMLEYVRTLYLPLLEAQQTIEGVTH
jgi:glycogen phosphorylase